MMRPMEPVLSARPKRGVKYKGKSDANLGKIDEEDLSNGGKKDLSLSNTHIPSRNTACFALKSRSNSVLSTGFKKLSRLKLSSNDVMRAFETNSKGNIRNKKGLSKWKAAAETSALKKKNSKPPSTHFDKMFREVSSDPNAGGYGRRIYDKDEIFKDSRESEEKLPCRKKMPKSLEEVRRNPQSFGIWDRVYDLSVIETLPPMRKDHLPDRVEDPEDKPKFEGYDEVVGDPNSPEYSKTEFYLTPEDFEWCLNQTQFSGEDVIKWFKKFRKDCPRGLLTRELLSRLCQMTIPGGRSEAFVDLIFRLFDNDKNGCLDFKEFLMAMDMTKCESAKQRLEWAFKMFDIDGNGEINMKELVTIIDVADQLEGRTLAKSSKKRAIEIYEIMDLDHDGSVSLEEFIKYSELIDGVNCREVPPDNTSL